MKETVIIFALLLTVPAFAQPTGEAKEEKTPAHIQPKLEKVPEINCYIDKETGAMICPGAIAAYRSLYGKCCHFDFRTNSTYCH